MAAETLTVNRRKYLTRGISYYVPAMAFDASLAYGIPTPFSLGSPAASDDDLVDASIVANAASGTIETQSFTADSYYGRTLIVTPGADPGAAGGVFDVYGEDWLGQPMRERFSGANGSTAILYGKKSFYRVTKTVIITATTNAITYKLGTGLRCGLPFRGDVVWAREDAVLVPLFNRDLTITNDIAGASIVGGPSGAWVYADFPGYVKTIRAVANMPVGSTNDPAITIKLATVAIVGLTVTADVSAAATGALVSDNPTTAGYNANNRFVKGGLLEIVLSDADAAVGGVTVSLVLAPTQVVLPDDTDPATTTTGDPRGSYESLSTLAGFEIIVGLLGNPSVNAAGNGGLHGIQHVA